MFNKPLIEAITYIRVYETHCIHIQTYFMKHVFFIMLRASKARVPKDILLSVIIYVIYINDILYTMGFEIRLNLGLVIISYGAAQDFNRWKNNSVPFNYLQLALVNPF